MHSQVTCYLIFKMTVTFKLTNSMSLIYKNWSKRKKFRPYLIWGLLVSCGRLIKEGVSEVHLMILFPIKWLHSDIATAIRFYYSSLGFTDYNLCLNTWTLPNRRKTDEDY